MNLERINSLLRYEPPTGALFLRKTGRRLFEDDDGYVLVYDGSTGKRHKFRMSRLCWILGHQKIPDPTDKIIHRNLNQNDFSLVNLYLVSNSEYKIYKNAVKNLSGGIRLSVHPEDMYCYKVHWFEGSTQKTQTVQDVVIAKKLELKLKLRFTKILAKYCYCNI